MTDERLRALERRSRESGSPADEAAYLLERLRLGGIDLASLRVAMESGHLPSSVALGMAPSQHAQVSAWLKAVAESSLSAATLAATYMAAAACRTSGGLPPDLVADCVSAHELWAASGDAEKIAAACRRVNGLDGDLLSDDALLLRDGLTEGLDSGRLCAESNAGAPHGGWIGGVSTEKLALSKAIVAATYADELVPSALLLQHAKDQLVEWALRSRDRSL